MIKFTNGTRAQPSKVHFMKFSRKSQFRVTGLGQIRRGANNAELHRLFSRKKNPPCRNMKWQNLLTLHVDNFYIFFCTTPFLHQTNIVTGLMISPDLTIVSSDWKSASSFLCQICVWKIIFGQIRYSKSLRLLLCIINPSVLTPRNTELHEMVRQTK